MQAGGADLQVLRRKTRRALSRHCHHASFYRNTVHRCVRAWITGARRVQVHPELPARRLASELLFYQPSGPCVPPTCLGFLEADGVQELRECFLVHAGGKESRRA